MAPIRQVVQVQNVAKPQAKAPVAPRAGGKVAGQVALLSSALAIQAAPARADEVDTAIDQLVEALKATGEFVKAGVSTAEAGIEVLKQGYEVAAPVVAKGVEIATPVVSEAFKATSSAVGPLVKEVVPSIPDAAKVIESSGLDTKLVTQTASDVAGAVTPVANQVATFLQTADPVTLAEYGLAGVAALYLLPPVLGGLFGSLKGYAGELTAASVLDAVASDNNMLLIDVRTQKEKETAGVPDVPNSNKVVEVEFAVVEDRKLRGALRDPTSIEAQVTALQIASLKRVSKGTKIVLMDRNGSTSSTIAKELAKKGYGRVFVLAGGFDGRGGWVSSKLQIKPAATVLSAPPPAAKTVGKAVSTVATRRSLPAPKNA